MYRYMADACHGHVTLSKVRELHSFNTLQKLHLLPLRKTLCIVAKSPEILMPKNQAAFLNRLVGGVPFGLVFFSWDLQAV